MPTTSNAPTSQKVRVADFCNANIPADHVLPLTPGDAAAAVAELRRHADLPFVYLFTADQTPAIMAILEQLKTIRSTCYPHALVLMNGQGGPAPAGLDAETLKLAVITTNGDNPAAVAGRIDDFARNSLIFDRGRLAFPNDQPLPDAVDVLIVGAGITGLYAAQRMAEENRSYCIVEQQETVGGIWTEYANTASQVNSSEGAYRLIERSPRSNRDHSMTREILEDVATLAESARDRLFMKSQVMRIEKVQNGYATTVLRDGSQSTIQSKGLILAINDRVGDPREIAWPNQERYQGHITTGISDRARDVDWRGKKVVIVGMGAFAIENARTALEGGADHVTVVCRRHGTVCPKIIDYLNFATPYDENFQHPKKSNMRNMLLWKKLYKMSGATQPECWMGKIKHTGHTISVSDIWFIAHHLRKLETVTGSIAEMHETGVVLDNGTRIEADVVVNCVGFYRNASKVPSLCDYKEMYNINYVDKDFMYLADAYIDDDAFNSFFGSSVLEMAKFYLDVFNRFFDSDEYEEMIRTPGIEKIAIETRAWSQYIAGSNALINRYDDLREAARRQVDWRTQNFLEAHDLETYISENRREWYDLHRQLAGKPLAEADCLPYVFDKLLEEKF